MTKHNTKTFHAEYGRFVKRIEAIEWNGSNAGDILDFIEDTEASYATKSPDAPGYVSITVPGMVLTIKEGEYLVKDEFGNLSKEPMPTICCGWLTEEEDDRRRDKERAKHDKNDPPVEELDPLAEDPVSRVIRLDSPLEEIAECKETIGWVTVDQSKPYFLKVLRLMRREDRLLGTWTPEDEAIYVSTLEQHIAEMEQQPQTTAQVSPQHAANNFKEQVLREARGHLHRYYMEISTYHKKDPSNGRAIGDVIRGKEEN